jgi:hypothetical protein
MEIIIITDEMLLTRGLENISGAIRHYNRKVASELVIGIVTTQDFLFKKLK